MSSRLTFHFYPGTSLLHRWDARCKSLGLLLLAIGMLYMGWEGLLFFTLLFTAALALSRIPARALAGDLRSWAPFLLIIFVFQLFSFDSGTPAPAWWPSGYESIYPALIGIWRLCLILCYAMLFSMVTRPRDLQDAVIWFLRPFPFLPARRIALMVSLMLRFLPLILDQADEVKLATRARLGDQRKNPVLRMKFLVLPLLRRSIKRADDMALALAARGYSDELPVKYSRLPKKHLACLASLIALIALLAGWVPHDIPQGWDSFVRLALNGWS